MAITISAWRCCSNDFRRQKRSRQDRSPRRSRGKSSPTSSSRSGSPAPGQLPKKFAAQRPADSDIFQLEGQDLRIVPLGHTDTSDTTALHIPSIGLVIAGDAVYNETHLYLAECDAAARSEWLRALDIIEALQPKAVVCGHAVTDQDGSPRHIDATRRYIQDFNAALPNSASHLDLYNKMLALYPDRVNPGSLWAAAKAAIPAG
jgi:glyoxylase-like metal-dependent hydrolase (beta-lactamase superfamily II)